MKLGAYYLTGAILALLCVQSSVRAADPTVEVINQSSSQATAVSSTQGTDPTVQVVSQNGVVSEASPADDFTQALRRIQVFTNLGIGYDDNPRTTSQEGGAIFTNAQVTLSYHLPSQTTQLSLTASGGVVEYFGQRTDINGSLDLTLSRNLTRRLSVNANLDVVYRSEPDFNANNGPSRVNGNYVNLSTDLSASYILTRRVSLVSNYSFLLVRYEDDATAAFSDRQQNTFGEQVRFTLSRTTVLTANYSFLAVNYVSALFDSTTHFVTGGVEYRFSRQLRAQVQAGASFRSFEEGASETDPNFNASLNYALSGHTTLSLTSSYSVDQPTEQGSSNRKTFNSGLQLTHNFTGRVSGSLGVSYHHDDDQQTVTPGVVNSSYTEDIFDLGLNLRYEFNRRLSFNAGFDHSEISSEQPGNSYSRNRYSVGLNYSF